MKKIILSIIFLSMVCSSLQARGTAQAILVNPYFNLGYVSPGDINTKITEPTTGVQQFVPTASTIKWSKSIGAFLGYRFNHRFNVGLVIDRTSYGKLITQDDTSGFEIWHPSSPDATIPGVMYYEFNTGASATSFGPEFDYTVFSGGKIDFSIGVALLYAKTSYYQDATYGDAADDPNLVTNLASLSGSGGAWGGMLKTSTSYYITNYLGLSFDLGYRYLKCSSLTDANGDPLKFQFTNGKTDAADSNMTVDFSGLYFGFGLKLDFNIGTAGSSSASQDSSSSDENSWNESPSKQAGSEFNNNWEAAPAPAPMPVEEGPSTDDIKTLKKQVQRKYNDAKTSTVPDVQAKAERYQKLYDIVTRLERDWDQFSPKSRKDKIEKIRLILTK